MKINLNLTGVSSSSSARSCPWVMLLRGCTLSQPGWRMILLTATLTASAPASVLSLTPRWTLSWSGEVRRHSRGHRDLAQSSGVMDSQGSRHVLALPLLAQTQWAAVSTWLWVTRLPPHRTEMGPALCRRRLESFLSMRTFQGAFSAQLETPPDKVINLTQTFRNSQFTNNELLDLRT